MIDRRDRDSRQHDHALPGDRATRPFSRFSVAEDIDAPRHEETNVRHLDIEDARRTAAGAEPASIFDEREADTSRSEPDDAGSQPASGFVRFLPGWARLRRAQTIVGANDDKAHDEKASTETGLDGPPPVQPEQVVAPGAPVMESRSAHRVAPADDVAGEFWKPLIDPMKVFQGIGRSKALIVALALLGAVAGAAIAISTPKKYEATTELIVDPRNLNLTDHSLTDSILTSDATLAIVENQMRVLTSGTVLNKVVEKLGLDDDPEFNGTRPAFSLREFIRSLLPGGDSDSGGVEDLRHMIAVRTLGQALSVNRSGNTFVISITAATEEAEKSALIANTMTEVFLQTFGQLQSKTAGRATEELTSRLAELRKGVESAERKVEDFRAAHDLVDAKGQLISDNELLKLNEQLSVARARTTELNARAASVRAVDTDSALDGAIPEGLNSPTMQDLRLQYATLKQEADRAAMRYGPRHPRRQVIEAQLAGARRRIATELQRIAASLQTELKRAVQVEQDLASRLAQEKVQNARISDDLVTLRELQREATAKRTVYEAFLLRARQTDEQKGINTANISVISRAFPPLDPTGPSRAMITLAGLLLGLGAGIGIGALRGAYESLRESAERRTQTSNPPSRNLVEASEVVAPVVAVQSESETVSEAEPAPAPPRYERRVGKPDEDEMTLDEIRASLREFREAVRAFSESRSGRNYF